MDKNSLLNKTRVFVVSILFLALTITPIVTCEEINETPLLEQCGTNQDASSVIFYTFGRSGTKQTSISLSPVDATEIYDIMEELRYNVVYEPFSEETKATKAEFIDLINTQGLLTGEVSEGYVSSLLNPGWLRLAQNKHSTKFKSPFFGIKNLEPKPYSYIGSAIFCSISSGGSGLSLPLIMLPRPRGITVWTAESGATAVGELLRDKGFVARGAQRGLVLGFMGIGLTFAFPDGTKVYGFVGYSIFAMASADEMEYFPLNREPTISEEHPFGGTDNIPISLSELSFKISDPDGDRMSYTVTTQPDIGTGQGDGYDGVYTVPINNLKKDKTYKWTVEVSDGNSLVKKTFGFITEKSSPFNPFDNGWQYRKKITINHSQVAGNPVNFPVLISTIDSDLRDKAQPDGDDILFMDGVGVAQKLYHEIEHYNSATGELIAWVNVTSLSSTTDTNFYLYYGNSLCDNQENTAGVWDSNYALVYHLDELASPAYDSTSNIRDGTWTSSPTSYATGKTGKCMNFPQAAYMDFADFITTDRTIETWVNWNTLEEGSLNSPFLMYDSTVTEYAQGLYINPSTGAVTFAVSGTGITNGTVSTGNWYYVAISYNAATKAYICVLNGDTKGSGTAATNWNCDNLYAPGYANANGFNGKADEMRISKTGRTSSWIKTTYNNQNSSSTFASFGPEES